MSVDKYVLPNGNLLIWTGKWAKEGKITNVLILAGGNALFLRIDKILPLWEKSIREDMHKLSYREFIEKYKIPIDDWELYLVLKTAAKMLENYAIGGLTKEIYEKFYDSTYLEAYREAIEARRRDLEERN